MSAFIWGPVLFGTLMVTDPQVAVAAPVTVEPHDVGPLTPPPFDTGRLGFTVTTDTGLDVDFSVFALFLAPGETLGLVANEQVDWTIGDTSSTGVMDFSWQAPQEPGLTTLEVRNAAGEVMTLNLVTMRAQAAGDGDTINGYRIGQYPAEPYRGQANYAAPIAFAEVSGELADVRLSPHFRLGQFLCKQEGESDVRYLIVSERLVMKLETILEAANARGWRTDGFTVMSGYRTPAYNAGLGNGANSRHIYGGAADIFIDTDEDGVMDDLNGDGVLDRRDAALIYDLVEDLSAEFGETWLAGGLGEYGPNAYHGSFVHVDERGWRARWGR